MVSTRDNFLYHEMMSHPALNSHPNPQTVVVVGGGDCGTLREVLKHPEVKSATQVEIDERVTRLRSEEHTSELQSLMRISYAVFCLKKKKHRIKQHKNQVHKEHIDIQNHMQPLDTNDT